MRTSGFQGPSDWVHEHREELGREFRLYPYGLQQR